MSRRAKHRAKRASIRVELKQIKLYWLNRWRFFIKPDLKHFFSIGEKGR